MRVFDGYTPDGIRCGVVLESDGFLYVVTDYKKERFNDEQYTGEEDFAFILTHEGFRRA